MVHPLVQPVCYLRPGSEEYLVGKVRAKETAYSTSKRAREKECARLTNKGDANQLRFGRKGNTEVSFEVEFSGVEATLALMKTEKNRAAIEK
jgi:hypothetical protein